MTTTGSREFLAAGISGVLLWASFFPLNLAVLAWVALVPFFALVRSTARPRRIYIAAFVCGLVWFVPALQWLRVAHPMMHLTWIGLSLYCSGYLVAGLWLLRFLDRRIPNLMITAPIVWVVLEYVRGTVGGGFAWYLLGHSQHDFLPIVQIADVTGAWGITFAIVLMNASIFECLSGTATKVRLAIPVGLIALMVGYGLVRMSHDPFPEGPQIALVQGNLSQDIRNARNDDDEEKSERAIETMRLHHIQLSEKAAFLGPQPNLIVWPETSYPYPWIMIPDHQPKSIDDESWKNIGLNRAGIHDRLTEMSRAWQSDVLFGLNGRTITDDGRSIRWNTSLLFDRTGSPVDTYHKMHRVPFGEFVPFKESLPFMKWFTPYDYDYGIAAGDRFTRFPLTVGDRTYTFGVLICYEDSNPTLAREYNNGNDPVDFLVNMSNDGWFKGTSEHEQHLVASRFRAIETRRSLVRSVNMGISAAIDGDGRIIALPAETWSKSKGIEGVVSVKVPIDDRTSIYAMTGDWLPWSCSVLLIVGLLWKRR